MPKFGPTRGELWMRLCFSLGGLMLLAVAFVYRGVGEMVLNEVMLIAGAFFGGSAAWSAYGLWTRQ